MGDCHTYSNGKIRAAAGCGNGDDLACDSEFGIRVRDRA